MQQGSTHTYIHSTAFDSSCTVFAAPFIDFTPKFTPTMEGNLLFFFFALNGQNICTEDRSWETEGSISNICANFAVPGKLRSVDLHIRGKGTEGDTSLAFFFFLDGRVPGHSQDLLCQPPDPSVRALGGRGRSASDKPLEEANKHPKQLPSPCSLIHGCSS